MKADEQKAARKLSADLFILAKDEAVRMRRGLGYIGEQWRLGSVLENVNLCLTKMVNMWGYKKDRVWTLNSVGKVLKFEHLYCIQMVNMRGLNSV